MGHFLNEEEIKIGLASMDVDGDGSLSYDEFQRWWSTSDRFEKLRLSEEQLQTVHTISQYFQVRPARPRSARAPLRRRRRRGGRSTSTRTRTARWTAPSSTACTRT